MLSNKDGKRNSLDPASKDGKKNGFDPAKLDALWQRIQLIKNGRKPDALNREQIRPDLYDEVKVEIWFI